MIRQVVHAVKFPLGGRTDDGEINISIKAPPLVRTDYQIRHCQLSQWNQLFC